MAPSATAVAYAGGVAAAAVLMTVDMQTLESLRMRLVASRLVQRVIADPSVLLLVLVAVAFTRALYSLFLRPADLKFASKMHGEGEKRIASLPPPYPNGWFFLCFSDELPRKSCRYLHLLGQHLVLFRGENGVPHVLDAYCPHLGANLAIGGEVKGDCIRCPFHGWEFDGDGKCVLIPYSEKIPSVARTRSWPVREVNRGVYLWHDVDDQPPAWEIPEIADLKRCFFHGVSRHDVNAHIQELPENGADSAHLDALHGRFVLPWLTALTHTWSAKWTPGEEAKGERHLGHMVIHQAMALSGREMGFTRIRVTGAHVGPGVVHLCMRTPLGPVWIIENVTPHAPLLQKTTIAVYAPWTVPRFVAKLLLHSFVAMFERDVPVWSNKTFVSKPMVVKEDGNILEYRRWFSQFYSKDRTRAKPNLDW